MEVTPEVFEPKDRFDIQVALKIIRHISSGIYRDRAGSLRELISNAFDAQATKVSIDTGYPKHNKIVVRDNGLGIDGTTLRKAFTQIGLSLKKTNPELYSSDLRRPMIGQFGIGFLAVAHISKDIWITSYPRDKGIELKAHIDLKPYFLYQDSIETFDEFKFGTVNYQETLVPKGAAGTTIELRDVSGGNFHKILTHDGERLLKWPAPGSQESKPGSLMKQLVERSQRMPSLLYLDRLQGREEILWHLGMTAPVRYLDGGPIRPGNIEGEAEQVVGRLRKYNEALKFEVWMDGVEVRKPILLPNYHLTREDEEFADLPKKVLVSPLHVEGESERHRKVKAEGYLFYQPSRIVPAELRGLYPRVRGVGIGYTYENRFLSYLTAETPILRVQISGELYVFDGLEEALNLDRSGFMELDPEYQYLADRAGRQVTDFFHAARTTHGRRRRSLKEKEYAAERDRQISSIKRLLKHLVDIRPDAKTSELESDFVTLAVYPVGAASDLVIDRGKHQIFLSSTAGDEILLGKVVLAVDWILGRISTDASSTRREFAKTLG